MKRLYIIRHAQAEAAANKQSDFERNLTDKGTLEAQKSALQLAELLSSKPLRKSLIISSTANRATQTLRLFCSSLAWSAIEIVYSANIYEAHYLELLKVLNDIPEKYEEIILFGHNPGLSDLINYLSDDYINLNTACIASLTVEEGIGFSILSANTAKLKHIISP